jgi:hypothetical protein
MHTGHQQGTNAVDAVVDVLAEIERADAAEQYRAAQVQRMRAALQMAASRDKKLPNDVFDPVANAVAAIRYIRDRYGSPKKAIEHWEAKQWCDGGHLFRHPTLTYTPATGERAMIAERRPELLQGGAATARMLTTPRISSGGINRSSLIGPMPQRDYAALGASLAAMNSVGETNTNTSSTTYHVHGAGTEDVMTKLRREQHRHNLLRGTATLGRRR